MACKNNQNQFNPSNSSNGNYFNNNASNSNVNQVNGPPFTQNNQSNSFKPPENMQSNHFFTSHQQPIIIPQKANDSNPLLAYNNNHQQTGQNSAYASPQIYYNSY
jgi:hypothetical protein